MQKTEIIVYVLRNPSSGLRYPGITADLKRRLAEHANQETKGGQQLGGEFELVLREVFPSYAAARLREKFLKSGQGRRWLDEHLQLTRH